MQLARAMMWIEGGEVRRPRGLARTEDLAGGGVDDRVRETGGGLHELAVDDHRVR